MSKDLTNTYYLGLNGESYETLEALKEADRNYLMNTYQYIGLDGNSYRTAADLAEANARWHEINSQPIRKELTNDTDLRYLGYDGNYYLSAEDLKKANEHWAKDRYKKISK